MYLSWLAFLLITTKIGAVPLLTSWSVSIQLLEEHNTTDNRPVLGSTTSAIAVDFHLKRNEIYFSDGTGRIKRAQLRPGNTIQEPTTILEVKLSDGLAVDWVNDNIYWTDMTDKTVEMATLDGLFRKKLFNSTDGVENPRGIALDPLEGIMFWTDWGSSERVESSGLDGQSKTTIVSTGLFWPNAVTLDLNKKVVYILEARFAKIISCNYDGTNPNIVFSSVDFLESAFGLTFFSNRLFWDTWKQRAVFSMDLDSKGSVQTVYKHQELLEGLIKRMMGIKAVDSSLQKDPKVPNPCESKGCSHKCVNGRGFTASCICPFGFTLQADGKTCFEDGYLLVSWRLSIRRYTLQGKLEQPMIDGSKAAISLSYHWKKNLVFWSDIEEHRIYRAPLEQLNNKTVVVTTETCDGLAVDWVHDVLYWTDKDQNTLEAAQLDGSNRKILFSDNLEQPRAVAVEPKSGYIFWTDWGASPKIERSVLDGTERKTIIDQKVMWPNGITIDFEEHRIYWSDGKLATISSSQYDGSDRRSILEHEINAPLPFSISLFKDKIYWTDWTMQGLMMGNKSENIDSYKLLANSSIIHLRPNGVSVVHSSLQKEQENPCASISCNDLCLGTKDPQRVHCMGRVSDKTELMKTVKNDSIDLSVSGSKPVAIAVVKVKCVGRNGCSNDTRCSKNANELTLAFLNQTSFNITNLLPASHYDLHFQSPELNEKIQLVTGETDPPELPTITSVMTEERSATIKWTPVDTCVPGFDSYHYKLYRTQQNPESSHALRQGNTSDTKVYLDNLQGEVNYTLHLYTSDPDHNTQTTFKTGLYELPPCRTSVFLCNGVKDCEDGSDESLETCTAIESVVAYKKNVSTVSLRVEVPKGTKKNLHKFTVAVTQSGTPVVSNQFAAETCVIWPDSYCFTVSSLQYNLIYNFQVQAVLKDGKTGKSYETSARTREEESGPPEDLTVIGYTPTSVELQWRHPNQSNGNIRAFIVAISEIENVEKDKCCQEFPILESAVKSEEPTYQLEAGSLSPASTYSIIVSVKTLFIGGSATTQVHTPPPHMRIVHRLPLTQPSGLEIVWQPQTDLDNINDQPQYHTLIKYYLLLALVEGEEFPAAYGTRTHLGPIQSLVESKIGSNFELHQRYDKNKVPNSRRMSYYQLPRGYVYQMVWVQVSQYKDLYSVDYIISDKFRQDYFGR